MGNGYLDNTTAVQAAEFILFLLDRTNTGIIGTDLVMKLLSKYYNAPGDYLRRIPAIMSANGDIVEVEFVMPGRPSQSLFLPKGTIVNGVK